MGALSYLFFTKLKNRILSLIKSPGKLIYVIVMIALIFFTIWGGNQGDNDGGEKKLRDIRELIAGAIALYSLLFILSAKSGFGNCASLFSMADVNFLFPSPVNPRKVLIYGLIQQMGTSMLVGLFVLFQYSWLHNLYGLGYDALLLIFLGCVVSAFLGQVTAMVIYISTSSDEDKRRKLKVILAALLIAFVLYALYTAYQNGLTLPALIQAVNTPIFKLLPVSGWVGNILSGAFFSGPADILFGILLCVLLLALEICLVLFKKLDYYEDVLKSTETTHSAINDKKEGNLREIVPQNVKVGKTGFEKGWGADAFYYKHLLENRRTRVLIIDMTTFIFAICSIVFSFFVRSAGIGAVFAFATYMQVFSVALGRINKELTKPFIYLVPEPPMKKLIQCLRESLSKYILEAFIIFIPVSLILSLSPIVAVLCIIARITFAALFTAGNLLVERIWSGGGSKALVMLLYFAIMILLSLPGLALGIVLSFVLPLPLVGTTGTIFIGIIICNIPVSILAFYLSRNLLQYAELNNR